MVKKKNVIMIVADQWRKDSIGYSGNKAVYTPHLDALAKDGVAFSEAYCQNPVCVPSRCSFLTGYYPHTKGFRTMHNMMKDGEDNLLKTLKNNGYEVYWGGRNDFLNKEADPFNYCSVRDVEGLKYLRTLRKRANNILEPHWYYSNYRPDDVMPKTMDQVTLENFRRYLNKRDVDKPFFAYLALFLPHPPYGAEKEFKNQIKDEMVEEPIRLTNAQLEKKPSIIRGIHRNQNLSELTDNDFKKIRSTYYAMGTKLDVYIGKLFDDLKAMGMYDETMIVFMSDHGDYTGDYEMVEKNQNTFEQCLVNVPLIIKMPKEWEAKKRITNANVELIDVQATIMDYIGLDYPYTQFGKTLLPVIKGGENHRQAVFCEGGRLASEGMYAMDGGHSVESEYWPRTSEQEKMPQHTKAIMIKQGRYKYVYRLYEGDEFYDLEKDPNEKNNCIETCDDEILSDMKSKLLEYMVSTCDIVPHVYDERR